MLTLVLATRNEHKTAEIRSILGSGQRYLSLRNFANAPAVIEDAPSFAGNATKKAVSLATWLAGLEEQEKAIRLGAAAVLADDSGLEVDALGGAPGVHSARFAALDRGAPGNSPDAENNAKLLGLLASYSDEKRTARFRCVLALTPVIAPSKQAASPVCYAEETELVTRLFEGVCEGHIALAPKGQGGFGYDPLFVPCGYEQTFGELGEEIKNGMSHRARALEKLKTALQSFRP